MRLSARWGRQGALPPKDRQHSGSPKPERASARLAKHGCPDCTRDRFACTPAGDVVACPQEAARTSAIDHHDRYEPRTESACWTCEARREGRAGFHHRRGQAHARAAQHRGVPEARKSRPQPWGRTLDQGSSGHRLRAASCEHFVGDALRGSLAGVSPGTYVKVAAQRDHALARTHQPFRPRHGQ